MVILSNKIMQNYQKFNPQEGVMIKLPWCCGNVERLIPIYAGQLDGAHPTGLRIQFSKGHIPVPLPLSRVLRIVFDLERPHDSLQLTSLGG